MRILAVDLGTKRTGLAISDPDEKMALSLPTLQMTGEPAKDVGNVADVAHREGAGRIVVGLPFNMDGTEGPRAQETRLFIDELKFVTEVPVEAWDERLSSAEGESRLREAGLYRKDLSKRTDAAAAIVILERYLEHRRNPSNG